MKSLSDFAEENIEPKTSARGGVREETIRATYDKYKNMSQGELQDSLFKEVEKQKADGSFDINALEGALNNIAPMLSAEQMANIKNYLDRMR